MTLLFFDFLINMKAIILSLALVFLILCCGCTNKQTESQQNSVFLDSNAESLASGGELFSSIDYIPLKESENFLLSTIDRILPYDSCFFLLDRQTDKIFKYDSQGNPLNVLSRRGGGPNEYIDIIDIDVDTLNDRIVMFCFPPKIIATDLNLNVIGNEKSVNSHCDCMVLWDNKMFIYSHFTFSVSSYDFQTGEISQIISSKRNKRKDNIIPGSSTAFHKYNGELYFQSPGDDCLYVYRKGVFEPFLTMDFENKEKTYKLYDKESAPELTFEERINYPVPDIDALFEVNGDLAFCFKFGIFHYFYFNNNIKGQRFVPIPLVYSDGYLYGWDSSNNINITAPDYVKLYNAFMEDVTVSYTSTMDEEFENPVLVRYKLR
jgi:hypothetical protein